MQPPRGKENRWVAAQARAARTVGRGAGARWNGWTGWAVWVIPAVFLIPLLGATAGVPQADTAWERAMTAGSTAYREGRLAEAEDYLEETLREAEQFKPGDPRLGHSLTRLGTVYTAQGKYAAAEPVYQRALALAEQIFGPDHPTVAERLHNLGGLYYAQGQHAAAQPLL